MSIGAWFVTALAGAALHARLAVLRLLTALVLHPETLTQRVRRRKRRGQLGKLPRVRRPLADDVCTARAAVGTTHACAAIPALRCTRAGIGGDPSSRTRPRARCARCPELAGTARGSRSRQGVRGGGSHPSSCRRPWSPYASGKLRSATHAESSLSKYKANRKQLSHDSSLPGCAPQARPHQEASI